MIRLSTLVLAAAATAFAVPATFADDAPKKDRTEVMFKKLDTNNDGVIEKVEFDAPRVKIFERIDKDKDGRITVEEIEVLADKRAKRAGWSDEKKAKWIAHMGVTTPQGVTREEFLEQKSVFTRIDADSDGKITVTEVKAYSDKQAERRAKRAAKQEQKQQAAAAAGTTTTGAAATGTAATGAAATAGAAPAADDADDADLDTTLDADDGTDG
ncbi:EF-hand domain-containing protein [Pseudoxanthobacter sp. M-2]|uniref:EF-hand domain-containing protein n=1 Tax=Pseudoxanthobacter sp. M-2 TaxID=3078754 RepID=UPI0038FCDB59